MILDLDWIEYGFGTRAVNLLDTPNTATLKQIHSAACLVATTPGLAGEGDALLTDRPGLAVGVKTADCVPILIADPVHRAVAAVHAGWRGTAASIGVRTVERMTAEFGSRPGDLVAAIGPSIGKCCFEIGPEVAEQLAKPAGRMHFDLAAANRDQLVQEAGLNAVWVANLCTTCGPERKFESFRRDGTASGRMLSFIRIRKEEGRRGEAPAPN